MDQDGRAEVLWGGGAATTGPDRLYVVDWPARTILSQTVHLDGPFVGPEVGDLDGDGSDEMVAVTFGSDSGYDGGRIVVIDGEQLTVRGISPGVGGSPGGSSSATGVHDVVLSDLDGDGRREILVATDDFHDGLIEAYSFSAANQFSRVWNNLVHRLASSPRSRSPTWTATVRSRCWPGVAPRKSRRRACSSMRTTR